MKARRIRVGVAVLGVAAASIALSGCSSSIEQRANATPPHVVSVEGPITDHDADLLSASWVPWEKANHITILYTGTPDFESSIAVEASQNNAPDLAIIAQPGLVVDLAKHQLLQPEPASVLAEAKKNFPASWVNYTATGGTNYGAPLMASVNGWVFYSPKQFAQWGVSVPKTWSQLLQLTDTIQQKTGSAPWCDGFSQGATSGENGVNWIDDLVLRDAGPTVYDQWVSHQIPFTDPHIQKAFSDLSSLLLNPKYVNADLGDVKSIDVSTTPEVASALESGKCALTHQPSSFVNQLTTTSGAAATISPDGDYWAFPLPSFDGKTTPVTGGGYFVAAFSSSADTIKVQQYLASVDWAKARVKLGGAISPDLSIPASLDSTPLEQASTKLLQDPNTIFRFDAADLMPAVVGSGTYLTGMVDWVKGTPTPTILSRINKSWPQ